MSRFPEVRENLPRRGNWLGRAIARTIYRLIGWRIEGTLPNVSRLVLIGGPHTSNWDGVMAVFTIFALDLKASWLVKNDIYVVPFKRVLKWLGAFPVNRKAPGGVVGDAVRQIKEGAGMWLCITPEGTRSKVQKWKTGFYRIALEANVPILPLRIDFPERRIEIGELFEPTGDMDADINVLKMWVSQGRGRHQRLE